MGDGGLSFGAVAAAQHIQGIEINSLKNVYLGPKPFGNKNLEQLTTNKPIKIRKLNNPIEQTICHLKENKVIGLVRGRMEFGPRALCNRSIIYKTSDRSANDWLNKRMNRTEFMPFAPVMTDIQAEKSFPKFNNNDFYIYIYIYR